jgi:hypothetical protein
MTSGIIDESADGPIKKLLKFQGWGIWSGDLAEMRRDSPPDLEPTENDDSCRPSAEDHSSEK